jgi:hypothetical protein
VVAGQYPGQTPLHGWSPFRKVGMAAYLRRGGDCWLDELKTLIDEGIPVIVLQFYGPEPDALVSPSFATLCQSRCGTCLFVLLCGAEWDPLSCGRGLR